MDEVSGDAGEEQADAGGECDALGCTGWVVISGRGDEGAFCSTVGEH